MDKDHKQFRKTLMASAIALAALGLGACQAEGDISDTGGITDGSSSGGLSSGGTSGGSSGGGLPNDGTTPSEVLDGEGGTVLPGNFICTAGAKAYGPNPTTSVVVNGLVGSAVTDLLNLLGAGTVTNLLNSVSAKELAVDGKINTAAIYSLTVGLLGGAISSVDLLATLNGTAPAGKYAVFGLTFPVATVELSLVQSVTVRTFQGSTQQEIANIDATALDLLGQVSTADTVRFVGLKVKKPYNAVSITLNPVAISANAGEAMRVHELCTDGMFVTP